MNEHNIDVKQSGAQNLHFSKLPVILNLEWFLPRIRTMFSNRLKRKVSVHTCLASQKYYRCMADHLASSFRTSEQMDYRNRHSKGYVSEYLTNLLAESIIIQSEEKRSTLITSAFICLCKFFYLFGRKIRFLAANAFNVTYPTHLLSKYNCIYLDRD